MMNHGNNDTCACEKPCDDPSSHQVKEDENKLESEENDGIILFNNMCTNDTKTPPDPHTTPTPIIDSRFPTPTSSRTCTSSSDEITPPSISSILSTSSSSSTSTSPSRISTSTRDDISPHLFPLENDIHIQYDEYDDVHHMLQQFHLDSRAKNSSLFAHSSAASHTPFNHRSTPASSASFASTSTSSFHPHTRPRNGQYFAVDPSLLPTCAFFHPAAAINPLHTSTQHATSTVPQHALNATSQHAFELSLFPNTSPPIQHSRAIAPPSTHRATSTSTSTSTWRAISRPHFSSSTRPSHHITTPSSPTFTPSSPERDNAQYHHRHQITYQNPILLELERMLMHDSVIHELKSYGAMCIITNVIQTSPAAQAGIKPGDVIIELGHATSILKLVHTLQHPMIAKPLIVHILRVQTPIQGDHLTIERLTFHITPTWWPQGQRWVIGMLIQPYPYRHPLSNNGLRR